MIVVDTSALMAIAQDEAQAAACMAVLVTAPHILVSAGTAEAMIVSGRRNVAEGVKALVDDLVFEVVPVTADVAHDCASAYAKWGKGVHPAGLNLDDCFAYALAQARGCPLLFVGDDFARIDVTNALSVT